MEFKEVVKNRIQKHQNFLIFRQSKQLCRLVGVKIIDPAAIHTLVSGGEDQMCGNDGRILHAGITLLAGVGKHVVLVKCNHQNGGRTIAAGCELVDNGEFFRRLHNIDMLFLQILCRRRKASRLQNGGQFFRLDCSVAVFLARVAVYAAEGAGPPNHSSRKPLSQTVRYL